MKAKAVIANGKDNVATSISVIEKGEKIRINTEEGSVEVEVNAEIPFGHKLSLKDIGAGEDVIKYGEIIGVATQDIQKGDYVHVHNVESKRGRGDLVK